MWLRRDYWRDVSGSVFSVGERSFCWCFLTFKTFYMCKNMCKQQNKHDGVSLESILFGASSLHPGFWQPETIVFGLENHKPTLSFNIRPKLLILKGLTGYRVYKPHNWLLPVLIKGVEICGLFLFLTRVAFFSLCGLETSSARTLNELNYSQVEK